MLEVKNLQAFYDEQQVLHNISFRGKASELVTLLGPSGVGKSTLLKVIAGLHPITQGDIYLNERLLNNTAPEHRGVVYISQEPSLFPHLNVMENMSFGLSIRKASKKEIQKKISFLIEALGLNGLEKRKPWQLSGGQKQRVAIGRALAIEAKVLLMDEPFSSLDLALRESLGVLIRKVCDEFDIVIVMVTHDPKEALSLSDKIILLTETGILQAGTPEEIYRNPMTHQAASMMGAWHTYKQKIYRPEDVCLIKDFKGVKIIKVMRKGPHVCYTLEGFDEKFEVLTNDVVAFQLGEKVKIIWR